jgi:hypothetical protein
MIHKIDFSVMLKTYFDTIWLRKLVKIRFFITFFFCFLLHESMEVYIVKYKYNYLFTKFLLSFFILPIISNIGIDVKHVS